MRHGGVTRVAGVRRASGEREETRTGACCAAYLELINQELINQYLELINQLITYLELINQYL